MKKLENSAADSAAAAESVADSAATRSAAARSAAADTAAAAESAADSADADPADSNAAAADAAANAAAVRSTNLAAALSAAAVAARSAADSAAAARSAPSSAARSAAAFAARPAPGYTPGYAAAESAASKDTECVTTWPRLWHHMEMPGGWASGWTRLRGFMTSDVETWGFWLEWYEAILEGRPLPWELSFRIATMLTDEDWNAGPAHVASRISEIRKAFDVARAVSDLRETTETVAADGLRVHRGHNNPPELIEEPALIEKTSIIWAAFDDLEREAKAAEPDRSRARQALAVVKEWFLTVCVYLGRKADLAVDTTIKWAIPAGGGYLMLNAEKVQKVIELAERWLLP